MLHIPSTLISAATLMHLYNDFQTKNEGNIETLVHREGKLFPSEDERLRLVVQGYNRGAAEPPYLFIKLFCIPPETLVTWEVLEPQVKASSHQIQAVTANGESRGVDRERIPNALAKGASGSSWKTW